MNAVEIEAAITDLAAQPFDPAEFPYAFLQAFGNKDTTIKRLRSGETNKSDVGGVLQAKNIHILAAPSGAVTAGLDSLRASPATAKAKARFILATDGVDFEAEDLESGETVACAYASFPDHFGFFLALAGITTVKQIRESAFDIRATSRLNRLYLELLKDNPDWEKAERRPEMNHFMARLIFCFFAEDTDIFAGEDLFTGTLQTMSAPDSSNTHTVMSEMFRAMNVKRELREAEKVPRWADKFPYVNGELFSGSVEVPRFSRIARSYLLHVGGLDWTQINPDIFGSMIQAVADDEERGSLGMHYTSVPNILKVLDPLFLDDLRAQLRAADGNARMLLNLRKRIARIRVFDPACGSGNFLVIAYKQMRAIEHEINTRRGELGRKTDIPLTNFRGVELRDFPAEIARLALIIAEFQCNQLYLGQREALDDFLPLDSQNWITCGNALRLDWLSICPSTGKASTEYSGDLFEPAQPQMDFENSYGETFICGNPPYKGGTEQNAIQKSDMKHIFGDKSDSWKSLDYVCGWFLKFSLYAKECPASSAFVSTNSIVQGEQVARLWPLVFQSGLDIVFAHTSFKWSNLASHNAGVTVVIVGLGKKSGLARLFENNEESNSLLREVENISPYLIAHRNLVILPSTNAQSQIAEMVNGSKPADGGNLILELSEAESLIKSDPKARRFIKRFVGSRDAIHGIQRYCLWILNSEADLANENPLIKARLDKVRLMRSLSTKELTKKGASTPHAFQQIRQSGQETVIIIPSVSSESRHYLPIDLLAPGTIPSNLAYALLDAPVWNMALLLSRLHLVWISTVCGKLKTDFRYSSTLGWNTFPVPTLTEKNKADLTRCAEEILLAREVHFPATIADLYDPETMPADLSAAHDRNDEVLDRIYIGRRFRNDTERLEKLFDLYTKMTASAKPSAQAKSAKGKKV